MIDYLEQENATAYTEGGRTIPNDPGNRDYQIMQEQIAASLAQIIPWAQYRDTSDAELRNQRYTENATYSETLAFAAESEQTAGTVWDDHKTKKENQRRNNRAKGKAKLTAADDHLADYIDSVLDALDQADDTVENLDRAGLESWDAETSATWPAWAPLP